MAEETQHDLPTLVNSLQAATVEWNLPAHRLTNSSVASNSGGSITGVRGVGRYLRYVQVLQDIDHLFADVHLRSSTALVEWCSSLQQSSVSIRFGALIVDHILQGMLPYVALQQCLRLLDTFLGWVTQPHASSAERGIGAAGSSSPVLVPDRVVVEWIKLTWTAVTTLSRDNAGTSSPTSTASLCGALQLLPILLRWHLSESPLPPFRRAYLPHPVNMLSLEARLLAMQVLPSLLQHQPGVPGIPACTYEVMEYLKRACTKATELSVRIAVGTALRGVLEVGLRISSPTVAYTLIDMLLTLCDEASLHSIADEDLQDVGVAMGYLLSFYQCDFTMDVLGDILQASTASTSKPSGEERSGYRGMGGGSSGRVRWQFFGGSDVVEGNRVMQRSFNARMSRAAQRTLSTALATLCSCCATPATTADAIQCCFVLLVPTAEDARAYMPRLLADAMLEWAAQLPSNGYRVVLADALRGYIQRSSEDKAVARTATVALQGVMLTLTSSLEIGFNVAEDVLEAVLATPSLLHTGVEVLGAVARTNVLYARHLRHQCGRVDSAGMANTLSFQLHVRALLDAASVRGEESAPEEDTLGDEDRVSLVHMCIRLLLRLSRGDPPRTVQSVHYRQAELIFRLTQLLYDLLRGSAEKVLSVTRDELLSCTVGFMNLLVGSPAPTIAYYKAVAAACVMLRRAPVISDMERMLAVGFLEAHFTSQSDSTEQDASTTTSSAVAAYFAISRGCLFELISSRPWPTCKDDGSLRWLAAQALKDVATACRQGVPVLSFADACDETVASAAQSMRLLRADFLSNSASEASFGASTTAAETPTRTVEECGSHAVRLLRWTLRHFLERAGADSVCAALLISLRTELYEVYGMPVGVSAGESAEDEAQRDVALWNCLCTVEQFLQEASPRTAAALWQNAEWSAEVKRWQSLAAQLVSNVARASLEVRLLAAKVLGRCLVSTDQVDLYTSQIMSAAAQGFLGKSAQYDALSALMVLSEAHSCYKECSVATVVEVSIDNNSSPTLPLATSLLAEAWKQVTAYASVPSTAAAISAPLLLLVSLRLSRAYPAEVEAALFDSVVAVLLTPMTAANRFWWSPESALGMLTALQQLCTAFPGNTANASAIRHSIALALLQHGHAAALKRQRAYSSTVVSAALDAVRMYTLKEQREGARAALEGISEQHNLWHKLLHQCLDHMTFIPPDEANAVFRANVRVQVQSTALRRRVMLDDGASRRLAVLWRMAMEGVSRVSPSAARGNVQLLSPVDVAMQVDVAVEAATRKEWVSVAQSMYTVLLSECSTRRPLESTRTYFSLKRYLDDIRAVLQARSPHVQVNSSKRDTDMFPAVGEAGAAETVRGGGSDSEDAKEYAEEYGEEGMGGILSEVGGAGGGGDTYEKLAPMALGLGTGGGRPAAGSLIFDVAAKEAAMWLLYGVLHSISASSSSTTCRENDDDARQTLLPIVVAAAQLVEVHPETQMSTIAVLHEVLLVWGNATQKQGYSRETPVLLQWKTQLVVGLTTVLQHGLLSLEGCTSLAVQYSRCNMADPSSCRRVQRSLLLLLHACHRLHERGRGFLLIGGSGAGHVIIALSKVAQASVMHPKRGNGCGSVSESAADAAEMEQSQRNVPRSLASSPCQASLRSLCDLFLAEASLANGYVQPANFTGLGWSSGGEDDKRSSASSSLYASRTSVNAGDVLQAVVFLTQGPLKSALGPALRHASGCLAVLVLSILPLATTSPPPPGGRPSASMEALTSIAALSDQLTTNHQRLLAQLAKGKLCARIRKWMSDVHQLQSSWSAVETELLRIATVTPVSRDTAATLLESITPALSQSAADGWKAEVTASLLIVGMAASLDLNWLSPLLTMLSVESLLSDVPQDMLARLQQAVRSYLFKGGQARACALALASPVGLFLVERCAASDRSSAVCYPPLAHRTAWPLVLQLLREAHDPLHTITVMWGCAPSSAHVAPSRSASLREQVPQHRQQTKVLLATLAGLGASSTSSTAINEDVVRLLLRCGRLMSELLVGIMTSPEEHGAAPAADALYTVLAYVVAVLCTPLSAAFAMALRPVGQHLVHAVAPSAGPALREAIQRLGSAKAMQLRSFMEGSCA